MLARELRLRSSKDISKVYSRGKSSGGSDLFVKSLSTGFPGSRAVVVVGKKVSKKAVTRNQIRRRVAEQLRQLWAHVLPGYDMVVTVTGDLTGKTPAQLAALLKDALIRGKLLNPSKED